MKIFSGISILLVAAGTTTLTSPVHAQLAITEVMSSGSTNLGPNQVIQNSDFWELTNFGTNTINLTGYRFDDSDNNLAAADPTLFEGLSIGAGESILFVQNNVNTNEASFRAWWGTNLGASVKIVFYSGNGLSSSGDGIRLWDLEAADATDVADSVDFGEGLRGSSFTYDPVTGEFGKFSTNGVNGAFKAEASDDVGSPGKTTGPTPLTILSQPTNVVANPGDAARFRVAVQGRPRGDFQWHFKGSPLAGATNATLEITSAQEANTGLYHVTVNNGVQTVTSSQAELVLQSQASIPRFTDAPGDLWMTIGQSFAFRATATGVPQPEFRWQVDGRNIDGATTSELNLANVSETDSGLYVVIAQNAIGSATNTFRVTVTQKPQLVITEVMSSSATNVADHADWWELSNLGTFPVSLKGYRFDDNSETLAAAFTFTNDVIIVPGESVIFVEGMTPEAFHEWWGAEYLWANLQILTYRGNGLSSAGDAVNIWNAAASDDLDKIASAVFSTGTSGVTFGFNPDSGQFGGLSVDGSFGAFAAVSGADVGSPGFIRNTARTIPPRFREIARVPAGLRLRWNAQAGTKYTLQAKTNLEDAAWTSVTTLTASENSVTFEENVGPAVGRRFYRIAVEP